MTGGKVTSIEAKGKVQKIRRKEHEKIGHTVSAEVSEIEYTEDNIILTFRFTDLSGGSKIRYDLDNSDEFDDLKNLTTEHELAPHNVEHLDGLRFELVYDGTNWIPLCHTGRADGAERTIRWALANSAKEFRKLMITVLTLPGMIFSGVRKLTLGITYAPSSIISSGERLQQLTGKQIILSVLILKKLLIVGAVLYLIL